MRELHWHATAAEWGLVNRIVPAAGIIHPLGSADLSPEDEKALRRRIVERALGALRSEVARPTVFASE